MTLLEKINQLNLKPRNAPAGVKVPTFGEWLRKLRAGQEIGEIPTALLTLYCDGQINESGGLKLGSAEIFSREEPIIASKADIYDAPAILETIKEKNANSKLPARSVTLHPFSLNTMDGPMTRKMKSDKDGNYWVLYCKKNKYRLELADAGCSIVTEEGEFVLSDFAEK